MNSTEDNTYNTSPFTYACGTTTNITEASIAEIFGCRKPNRNGYGLPTDKQITFAKAIESSLQIPLPEQPTFDSYRKYIADNADAFYAKEGNKGKKVKHIDAAGVITIDKTDTVFNVLDKFFYGGEKFINEESVTYYYGDTSFVEIHNDLGNTLAMLILKESIKIAKEDEEKKND